MAFALGIGVTTASLFDLARVRPLMGRTLQPDDERSGATSVAVIGRAIWENRFGCHAAVVGRTMRLNGALTTIVAVMPQGFEFPVRQDVWVPLRVTPLETPRGEGIRLEVFGRLGPGVSLDQASAHADPARWYSVPRARFMPTTVIIKARKPLARSG